MPNAEPLEARIPVATAARFLGCSARHVRDLIEAGDIDALDVRSKGKGRATWAVSVGSLRAFIAARERDAKIKNGDIGTNARERFQ